VGTQTNPWGSPRHLLSPAPVDFFGAGAATGIDIGITIDRVMDSP